MGIGIQIKGLTKSFGPSESGRTSPSRSRLSEGSVLLDPSGSGKSVFLKSLIGLLRPERGKIIVDSTNIIKCSAKELYEIRTLFGVMFQDGGLFGSMSLYDNTAFPHREHTKKKGSGIRQIVMEKLDVVGLTGDETKFPDEISGGVRKRAGRARAPVLDPQIILCDKPDSGLDPARTAYLSQVFTEEIEAVPPHVNATPGMPERPAVHRRQAWVREMMHTLPPRGAGSHPQGPRRNSAGTASARA